MKIQQFFHKIKIGFVRMREESLPYVSEEKEYGSEGEIMFVNELKKNLPTCEIKQNIFVNTADGNAEIDCLVFYHNNLFAIEVKRWNGRIIEKEDGFIKEKNDYWTDEKYETKHKSPFKQLKRAIYLLKKQVSDRAWINDVVFFMDDGIEKIETISDNVWFSDINDLVEYIKGKDDGVFKNHNLQFFKKCVESDRLNAENGYQLNCIIDEKTLQFEITNKFITKDKIKSIQIKHHWSYDKLTIILKDGAEYETTQENAKIKVEYNGEKKEYALCKLENIKIGS